MHSYTFLQDIIWVDIKKKFLITLFMCIYSKKEEIEIMIYREDIRELNCKNCSISRCWSAYEVACALRSK